MIKGAQKQMIVVRTGNSRYFDEAYFVLRREIRAPKHAKTEMLAEAYRILAESAGEAHPRRIKRLSGILLFAAGLVLGGGVAVLICLLVL